MIKILDHAINDRVPHYAN